MPKYLKKLKLNQQNQTPQSEPIPGKPMVRNSSGGYSFAVDDWKRLSRFLVLGTEGGSFYVSERSLTVENAASALTCIQSNGTGVVRKVVAVSEAGRAPKNDPAILVLALCAGLGDELTRRAAFEALPRVCRTGTHLFQFAEYVQTVRGWGRGLRRGVGAWYNGLTPRDLAYQLVKYRQREGWTHTDVLRLAHPAPASETHNALYKWVTKPEQAEWARTLTPPTSDDGALAFVWAFERAQTAESLDTILKLIDEYDLPREALPTQWLNEKAVWERLLVKMPMTALIRNLGVMSKVGLLKPLSAAEQTVVERLTDGEWLRKARVHPLAVLSALRVYANGHGMRGKGSWQPVARVVDALDEAFYLAFGAVEPANKRTLLALDVSGSMMSGVIAGVPGLTPRDASAALALVTARTEPQYTITAFSTQMIPLNLSAQMRLHGAIHAVSGLPFGGTDCAQPMLYALEQGLEVDTFIVLTDSETWAGTIHPVQALHRYRSTMNIPARLVVVCMVANNFTIADPSDAGMLDVVGMDTATPGLINDFSRGAF